jgi:hypothetical protein
MTGKELATRRVPLTVFAAALLTLAFSWVFLFSVIGIATWSLAPYDTSWYDYWGWPSDSPPPGSWQRSLNSFFEKAPGSVLPAVFVVGASIALFTTVSRRARDLTATRLWLVLGFALTNLVIGAAAFFDSLVIDWPLEVGSAPGYDWTVQFLIPDLLLLAILFGLQGWAIPRLMRARFPSRLASGGGM